MSAENSRVHGRGAGTVLGVRRRASPSSVVVVCLTVSLIAAACGNRTPGETSLATGGSVATDNGVGATDPASGMDVGDSGGAPVEDLEPGAGPESTGGGESAGPSGDGVAASDSAAAATGPGSTGDGAPAGPATYDQGAGDSEITFGSVSSITGVLEAVRPEAARAYFKLINERGGVNGRTLNLRIYDDQWDVARHAALVRQAFEQDKVFAFTGNFGILTDHGANAYVESKNIPVIGGDLVDTKFWGASPMAFPHGELEAVAGGRLGGRFAAAQGCKRVAAQSYNIEESTGWAKAFEQGLADAGVSGGFVYEGQNSLAETDFTSYALAIKQSDADCVTAGQFDTHTLRLRQAMENAGIRPLMVQPSTFYSPLLPSSGLHDGDFGVLPTDILENNANPAIAEINENIYRLEPGLRGKMNGWALSAWASAKLAVEAVRRAGNNLTRENLVSVLQSGDTFDTGISPPISFASGPKTGSKCATIIQISGDSFRTVKGNSCL